MTSQCRQGTATVVPTLLVLLALVACSLGTDRTESAVVRDSAGIRIVESSAPLLPAGAGWSVGREPIVEIGANESDSTQTLHRVESAMRLDDGRIVVANGAPPALRWYDTTGAFVFGTGRYGQGPGEFDGGEGSIWIYALWRMAGDSTATWEHSRRRMQVFDPQGRYVRSVVIDLPPKMPERAYPQITGRIDDGFIAFLADEREEDGPLGVVKRDSVTFIRYTGDGRFARTIAQLPGFVRYIGEFHFPGRPPMRGPMGQPFAPTFVGRTHGSRFHYGNTERFEITAYDTAGTVRTLIRRIGARRPLAPEIIEEYRRTSIASAGNDPARRRQAEDRVKSAPYPDSLPAFRSFRFDRDGMLWVQGYEPRGAPSVTWSVFDPDGRWVTDVPVPGSWEVVDIGRDYILTIETNELDVERVRMYKLTRTRSEQP